MILALPLLILPALLGILALIYWRLLPEAVLTGLVGTVGGITVGATAWYAVSLIVPLTPFVLWTVVGLMAFAAAGLGAAVIQTGALRHLAFDRHTLLILIIMIIACSLLVGKLMWQNDDGIGTSILNAWGDIGWHMANITIFAEGQTVPPSNPIFAGERLTYPFLINFLSGTLLAAGASLVTSYLMPAFILLPVFFTLFYVFSRRLTGNHVAAVVALILLVGSGSVLGWLQLKTDVRETSLAPLNFLLHLPRDYTGAGTNPDGHHFLNIILAGLLPQRSFLLGMPLAMAIVLVLQHALATGRTRTMLLAGVLAGVMPLAHAHTVLVLMPAIILIALFYTKQRFPAFPDASRFWACFLLPAFIIGLPEILYFVTGTPDGGSPFLRYAPGWTAGEMNPVWFWLQNTGLYLPLIVGALLWRAPRPAKLFAIAGLIIFAVANIFAFAPWAWDNYKLLIYWLMFSLPLVGWLAAQGLASRRIWIVAPTLLLIILHAQTGLIDLIKTALPTAQTWIDWDNDAIAFANHIQAITPRQAVIVTAPYHNNPVALSGRRAYLGFSGHVWSHGGNPFEREPAIAQFYNNTLATLPDIKADYVVVGPVERRDFTTLTIRPEWVLAATAGPYELYQVP
jgi:hypothetical protein